MAGVDTHDLADVSPTAWRLLRVAADFSQRDVERAVADLRQAHVSMLESGNRGLSVERLHELFDLYVAELDDEQVEVLVEHF
ncbi:MULTISPECIES: helix-turn-helix transcriptional regulator [Halobacterium]|uniref:helix-turn-helix transcriptional regulator n=1 Tax=Halobacterium TaxID=2239 RepID=UPI00073E4A40|nr:MULTISPECIES: helix-turn-helix transcriptional regulator [Halobacterium]MCG1003467.1 helix-turn-helix transcriptional regulator [Halobacterium noricense]